MLDEVAGRRTTEDERTRPILHPQNTPEPQVAHNSTRPTSFNTGSSPVSLIVDCPKTATTLSCEWSTTHMLFARPASTVSLAPDRPRSSERVRRHHRTLLAGRTRPQRCRTPDSRSQWCRSCGDPGTLLGTRLGTRLGDPLGVLRATAPGGGLTGESRSRSRLRRSRFAMVEMKMNAVASNSGVGPSITASCQRFQRHRNNPAITETSAITRWSPSDSARGYGADHQDVSSCSAWASSRRSASVSCVVMPMCPLVGRWAFGLRSGRLLCLQSVRRVRRVAESAHRQRGCSGGTRPTRRRLRPPRR